MGPSGTRSSRARPSGSSTMACQHALCCNATLVSALARNGLPAHAADSRDGAAIAIARRREAARHPEFGRGGPQRPCVLAAEAGGRWGNEAQQLVRQLVRLRGRRVPTALCALRRGGRVAGGAFWPSRSSVLSAALCWALGACRRSRQMPTPSLWPAFWTWLMPRCQAGCRCPR